jgi:predicted RNA-binding protein associated with RNAse of E/G family
MLFHSFTVYRKEVVSSKNNFIDFSVVESIIIMDSLSKAFMHYPKGSEIEKEISLKNIRKTYLIWVNQVMKKDTKMLSCHSTDGVVKEYYLDPTVLTAIEKGTSEN